MLQSGRFKVQLPMRSFNFSICLILPATLWPWGLLSKNEYQKIFLGVKCSQHVRLTTSLPCVSRLSGKCGILDISQPYRPPLPVTEIDSYTFSTHTSRNTIYNNTDFCEQWITLQLIPHDKIMMCSNRTK
jgi:hypothetical protein